MIRPGCWWHWRYSTPWDYAARKGAVLKAGELADLDHEARRVCIDTGEHWYTCRPTYGVLYPKPVLAQALKTVLGYRSEGL